MFPLLVKTKLKNTCTSMYQANDDLLHPLSYPTKGQVPDEDRLVKSLLVVVLHQMVKQLQMVSQLRLTVPLVAELPYRDLYLLLEALSIPKLVGVPSRPVEVPWPPTLLQKKILPFSHLLAVRLSLPLARLSHQALVEQILWPPIFSKISLSGNTLCKVQRAVLLRTT